MVDHVHSSSCDHAHQPDEQWDKDAAIDNAAIDNAVADLLESEDARIHEALSHMAKQGIVGHSRTGPQAVVRPYSGKVQNRHDPRYVHPQAPQWNLRPTRMAQAINYALYGPRG